VGHERDSVRPVHSHHEQLMKTVVQRLKWAAGANPSLAQTLSQFEDVLAADRTLLEVRSLQRHLAVTKFADH